MNVGTRLKQMRIAAGLEIQDAAERVGKSYQYIRQLEEGVNKPPTWELLRDLAAVYESSVDEILDVSGNKIEYLPAQQRTVLNSISNMTSYQLEGLVQIAKILNGLESKARKNLTDELFAIVIEPIEAQLGKEAASELYRAADLFRGTGDESALAAWFSRHLSGNNSGESNQNS